MSTQRYSVTPHSIETILTWVKSGEIAIGDKTPEMYSYRMGPPAAAAGDCGPLVGTGATAVANPGRRAPGPYRLTSEQRKWAAWFLAHTRPQPFRPYHPAAAGGPRPGVGGLNVD